MITWVLVLLIFGVLGLTGYYKGAIRSLVSLVGLLFAMFLALPLSPPLRPLVPKLGLTHPIWPWVLPPVVVFGLVVLIFMGLAFFVHYKVALHFKYGTDDFTRLRWERLNQRLGLCVGLVAGGLYSVLVGVVVYAFGYAAVQVSGEESPPLQRLLASAREELTANRLDRSLASLDPMPENYYRTTDIAGVILHNYSVLQERLADYPAFLSLGERSEFQEIGTDVDLLNMLQTKAPILTILNHPKILGVLQNAEIMDQLKQIDLVDLYNYLKTGKSEKYADEKILGRWKLDPSATLTMEKRKNPEMSAREMGRLKLLIAVFLPRVTFLATPDKQAIVKMELTEEAKRIVETARAAAAAAAAATQAQQPGVPQMSQEMMQRYGLRPRQPDGGEAPNPEAASVPANLPGIPNVNLASEGTWERQGPRYRLSLKDQQGRQQRVEGMIADDTLTLTMQGYSLIFVR